MSFMEAYKQLDNLLKTFEDYPKGVSSYIEEMERCYDPRFRCVSWNNDYDKLKRYRYIRNQISHDTYASEENMCTSADERWIRSLHLKILEQSDPLGQYYQRKRAAERSKPQPTKNNIPPYTPPRRQPTPTYQPMGCATFMMVSILAILVFSAGILLL